jgi:hypothetical protein
MNLPHIIRDISKKAFVLVFQLEITACTLARIFALLMERKIDLDEFHFHETERNQGSLMIHCQIERDRIRHTAKMLDKLPGVVNLDWLESKRNDSGLLLR